jgi:hypothetical protein
MVNLSKESASETKIILVSQSAKKKTQKKDTQSRSWTLCFWHIEETGYNIPKIESVFRSIPSLVYFCAGLEIGIESGNAHIHAYCYTSSPIRFSTLRNKFEDAKLDIEKSQGTAEENRDYCFKEGKWENDPKADQRVQDENARVEFGILPVSHKGKRSDLETLYDMIAVDNLSNAQILALNPNYIRYINYLDKIRQSIYEEKLNRSWRDVECVYVYGPTGTFKTRNYIEKYPDCYRITSYGTGMWDSYNPFKHNEILLDEFRGQVPIFELLLWIDGYKCALRSRYVDKQANFTKVIIISNEELCSLYSNVQREQPETWKAFLRRIQKVIHHRSKTDIITYNSVDEYLHRNEKFHPATEPTPFDEPDTPVNSDINNSMPFED